MMKPSRVMIFYDGGYFRQGQIYFRYKEEYKLAQKGVDVKMALDVLDFAHEDRLDVAVLITGDGDFVPLVHKITSLGKQALIAHFTFDGWKDSRNKMHKPCYTSRELVDVASWSLNFNNFVDDHDWKTEVRSLFFKPKEKASKAGK